MELTPLEQRFGPHLLQEKSADFLAKWQSELGKLTQSLERIPAQHQEDIRLLQDKISAIKEVLDVS